MIKRIGAVLLVTVFVFSAICCKSSNNNADDSKVMKQSVEDKAALLACECIKQLEIHDNDKYINCISSSLDQAINEYI